MTDRRAHWTIGNGALLLTPPGPHRRMVLPSFAQPRFPRWRGSELDKDVTVNLAPWTTKKCGSLSELLHWLYAMRSLSCCVTGDNAKYREVTYVLLG